MKYFNLYVNNLNIIPYKIKVKNMYKIKIKYRILKNMNKMYFKNEIFKLNIILN